MSWWWLLACTGTPGEEVAARLADCETPACTIEWVDARWADSDAADQIAAHPDEVVQLYVLQHLIETRPAELGPLCAHFSEGTQPRTRCQQLQRRPHLWEQPVGAPSTPAHTCAEKLPALVPDVPLTDPWGAVVPVEVSCPATQTRARCQLEAATTRAEQGDLPQAAARCVAIEDERWRYECAFQVMESSWQRGRHGDPGTAAGACLAAGPYLPCCLGHLAREVGLGAPAADEQAPGAWTKLLAQADELQRALQRQDPALAQRLWDQSLSVALTESFAKSTVPAGDPIEVLPESARPQLRAGVALALLRAEGTDNAERSAEAWLARCGEVLASRAARTSTGRHRPKARKLPDRWDWSTPVPTGFSPVPLLDTSRRLRGSTPEADQLIALLEVGATLSTPLPALARDAARHEAAEVRWTVARLASEHQASGAARALREDPDPRVQARARHR